MSIFSSKGIDLIGDEFKPKHNGLVASTTTTTAINGHHTSHHLSHTQLDHHNGINPATDHLHHNSRYAYKYNVSKHQIKHYGAR